MSSAEYTDSVVDPNIRGGNSQARTRCLKPMVSSGSLDKYPHFDNTPVIGREFSGMQVTDLLNGDEQLIKDLAVTSKWARSKNPTNLTHIFAQFQNVELSSSEIKMSLHNRCENSVKELLKQQDAYETSSIPLNVISMGILTIHSARIIRSPRPSPD
jgi:hypothetical protein